MTANKRINRRSFMQKSIALSVGTVAALSLEEKILLSQTSVKPAEKAAANLTMPMGKIKHLEISRIISGGNLITGHAHSRDLVYVSNLFKHYFTEDKICETLDICFANGVNTIITVIDEEILNVVKRCNAAGTKMQWIVQVRKKLVDEAMAELNMAIDAGFVGAQINGSGTDKYILEPEGIEGMCKVLGAAREKGLIIGIGAHNLETIKIWEEKGIDLDFYMKTIHHHNYWSSQHPVEKDNVYDKIPDETIKYMKEIKKPWIGFKVLAAGAISPTSGFKYALEAGADFLCVGMIDFQVKDDVAIFNNLFARGIKRERPWMA